MIKKFIKPIFKKNKYAYLLSNVIYWYLKIVYFTSRWQFVWPKDYNKQDFANENKVIFALWHNRVAFGPGVFLANRKIYALVSPHSDGRIISAVIRKFGYNIIEGSSNKDPIIAVRNVIKILSSGKNIAITPDGPRGPIYEIKSNIAAIAKKYATKLVPINCNSSRYFQLSTWDKMIMPLPFGKITVIVGEPVLLSENEQKNNHYLKQVLSELGD